MKDQLEKLAALKAELAADPRLGQIAELERLVIDAEKQVSEDMKQILDGNLEPGPDANATYLVKFDSDKGWIIAKTGMISTSKRAGTAPRAAKDGSPSEVFAQQAIGTTYTEKKRTFNSGPCVYVKTGEGEITCPDGSKGAPSTVIQRFLGLSAPLSGPAHLLGCIVSE